MKLQMIAQISGTRNGLPHPQPGEIFDFPEQEAKDLLAGGMARLAPKGEERATKADTSEKRPKRALGTKDLS